MSFEIYTREFVRTTAPKVTITNYGRIAINNSATKMLRKKQEGFVLLLWEKSSGTVGIQAIPKEDGRAYPLKAYGPKGRSGTGFSAVTFLNYINYDWSETHSFNVEWRSAENMLAFAVPQELLKGKPTLTGKPIRRFPRLKKEE